LSRSRVTVSWGQARTPALPAPAYQTFINTNAGICGVASSVHEKRPTNSMPALKKFVLLVLFVQTLLEN
jgi:hypothetical protein